MKHLEALKKVNYKELGIRAAWTFAQGFLAVFILSAEQMVDLIFNADWSGLYVLMVATWVASIAAGLSALKTLIIQYIAKLKKL